MNLSMIARYDNSGLGNLNWECARHFRPHKVLLVSNGMFDLFADRYRDFNVRVVKRGSLPTEDDMKWLMRGTDLIFSAETFYREELPEIARENGIKTVLMTMFEMTPERFPYKPDMFLCPSRLDYENMPEPKVYIPFPVALDRLKWKERTTARNFVHTASHGGMNNRKGTYHLIQAMQHVKSDMKLHIYAWRGFNCDDPRVTIITANYKYYWLAWEQFDVLVYPQDYNGICLPIQEAFASGLGVISTNIYPFNEYLPKELLYEPESMYRTRAANLLIEVDAARISPKMIAAKIDEVANTDISQYSTQGKLWAKNNSWKKLLPDYIKLFNEITEN